MVKRRGFMIAAGVLATLLFIVSNTYGQKPQLIQFQAAKKVDTRFVVRLAKARKLPKGMSKRSREALRRVVRNLKARNPVAAIKEWNGFSRGYFSKRKTGDVNAIISWILRESYLETNKDLAFYADKVRHFNEQKRALRKYLGQLRQKSAKICGDGTVNVRPVIPRNKFQKGKDAVTLGSWKKMTKKQTEVAIGEVKRRLSKIGVDAQFANIILQNMLQKQQRLMQLLSSVSKMLHDTAMAIIRNIR